MNHYHVIHRPRRRNRSLPSAPSNGGPGALHTDVDHPFHFFPTSPSSPTLPELTAPSQSLLVYHSLRQTLSSDEGSAPGAAFKRSPPFPTAGAFHLHFDSHRHTAATLQVRFFQNSVRASIYLSLSLIMFLSIVVTLVKHRASFASFRDCLCYERAPSSRVAGAPSSHLGLLCHPPTVGYPY